MFLRSFPAEQFQKDTTIKQHNQSKKTLMYSFES